MDVKQVLSSIEYCCSDDDRRPYLKEPFRDGEFVVATDGRIAIRYAIPDGVEGFPDEVEGHPASNKVFPTEKEYADIFKFSRRDIDAFLKDFWKSWDEHLRKGIERNPEDFEELKCPCCGNRLYRESYGELIDADEYDSNADDMYGFVIELPNGKLLFLRGCILSRLIHSTCTKEMGGIDEMYIYASSDVHGARLVAKGKSWDLVAMLYTLRKDIDTEFVSIGSLNIQGEKDGNN